MILVALIIIVAALPASVELVDPSTVCFQYVYQLNYFNMMNGDTGVVVVDFSKQRYTIKSNVTNNWILHDFIEMKSYSVETSYGKENITTCRTSRLHPGTVIERCLPASAKQIYDAGGLLGFQSTTKYVMTVTTYEVKTHYNKYRTTIADVTDNKVLEKWPVMLQEFEMGGTKNIYMYTNSTKIISHPTLLEIPDECNIDAEFPVVG